MSVNDLKFQIPLMEKSLLSHVSNVENISCNIKIHLYFSLKQFEIIGPSHILPFLFIVYYFYSIYVLQNRVTKSYFPNNSSS